MADPLSISAAVVQFLQVTVQLCLKLHGFCADMHDVPDRLGSLESDLKQQIRVAENIQSLVSGTSPALNSSSIDSLRAILDDYSTKMDHLLRILDSVSSKSHDGFFKRNWNALRALDKKNAMLLCCDQLAQKRSLLSVWLGKANMSSLADESLEYTIKVVPPTWLLSHTIHLSVVLRNWSSGREFSIAPVVIGTSRIVDPNTSPGFQTVRAYEELQGLHHFQNITKFMESLEKSLRGVLSAGQGSPLDEDRDGNTLLYEVIRLYIDHAQHSKKYWITKATEVVSPVQFLLDNGANPNVFCSYSSSRYGASRGTALDLFADNLVNPARNFAALKEIGRLLLGKLTEVDAESSKPLRTAARIDPGHLSQHFQVEMEELQLLPEQIKVCEYNGIVQAIIERDEAGFQKALDNCDSHHQSPATGLSAIHFSVTWPMALTALLRIGVDVNVEDHYHRCPIHLAASLGESEAVDILLEDDCAIWSHSSPSLLREALRSKNEENRARIVSSVITAYIDRHARFFDLALSLLPQSSPAFAELVPGIFCENLVPQIQQELNCLHFRIPPALKLSADGSSVYETADIDARSRLTVQMAVTLWDGGFRQIHEYSNRGTTPLLASWYNADFEMIKWLISKGASPFSRHGQTQGSGLHLYAHRLGYPGAYFKHDASAVYCNEVIISQLEL
ncbi:hypothetical protein INS49_007267 [Diaporthe citri]|uniref:uncharacterized protein n=1 Tax=Diaporthe citri TaxID=83186 RepID=UPI001C813EFD|nr:uncharacterized protein INS49_007267 [Diaporthe citri]KAG6365656.1 hypothetical protein INS49_007267 [Diaporthe citri]